MKLTLEMANEKLIRALRETMPAFRASMKDMVRKGARLAITKAISITPPMSSARGPTKETQRFAEKLIAGDVRRVLATAARARPASAPLRGPPGRSQTPRARRGA
jgi:hypothetical protein